VTRLGQKTRARFVQTNVPTSAEAVAVGPEHRSQPSRPDRAVWLEERDAASAPDYAVDFAQRGVAVVDQVEDAVAGCAVVAVVGERQSSHVGPDDVHRYARFGNVTLGAAEHGGRASW